MLVCAAIAGTGAVTAAAAPKPPAKPDKLWDAYPLDPSGGERATATDQKRGSAASARERATPSGTTPSARAGRRLEPANQAPPRPRATPAREPRATPAEDESNALASPLLLVLLLATLAVVAVLAVLRPSAVAPRRAVAGLSDLASGSGRAVSTAADRTRAAAARFFAAVGAGVSATASVAGRAVAAHAKRLASAAAERRRGRLERPARAGASRSAAVRATAAPGSRDGTASAEATLQRLRAATEQALSSIETDATHALASIREGAEDALASIETPEQLLTRIAGKGKAARGNGASAAAAFTHRAVTSGDEGEEVGDTSRSGATRVVLVPGGAAARVESGMTRRQRLHTLRAPEHPQLAALSELAWYALGVTFTIGLGILLIRVFA